MTSVHWDAHADPAELARLDSLCFAPAWDAAAYAQWLKLPAFAARVLRTGTLPEPVQSEPAQSEPAPSEPIGWVLCQQVGAEAEVLRIGIVPAARRRGWGRVLLDGTVAWLRERGATRVLLEVRASNAAALALYRAAGFMELHRRARYYAEPVEDAVVMAWELREDGGSA